jgi:hypothetical protein
MYFIEERDTEREDKKIYAGFMQGNVDIMFGHGLNEGYTQLPAHINLSLASIFNPQGIGNL